MKPKTERRAHPRDTEIERLMTLAYKYMRRIERRRKKAA